MAGLLVLAGLICWVILWTQFPAGLCNCRLKFWCHCGKKRRKAESRAGDIEVQERRRGVEEQARIESLFNFLATQFGQEAGFPRAQERAGMVPEDLFRQIGPTAGSLADIIGGRLREPPTIPFESTLQPSLRLAYDEIAGRFAQRGIPSYSGLSQEGFGRAGVELAIKEAQAVEQNRRYNEQLRQQTLADAGAITEFASGLSGEARGEQSELARLMAQLRQTGVITGQQPYEGGQQRAYGASLQGLGFLREREQAAAERNAQIGKAIGTTLAVAAAPFTGGASLAFAPALSGAGGAIGGGGSSQGGGASSYLDAMRIANLGGQQQPYRGAGASQYPWLESIYSQYPQRRNTLSRLWGG